MALDGLSFDFESALEKNLLTTGAGEDNHAHFADLTAEELGQQPGNYKKNFRMTVCTYWLRGLCMKGEACGFLHQFDPERMPVCRTLLKFGECKEPDCPYKHSTDEIKECNMYKLGFCIYGSACRYKHKRSAGPPPEPESVEAAKPRDQRSVNAVLNQVNPGMSKHDDWGHRDKRPRWQPRVESSNGGGRGGWGSGRGGRDGGRDGDRPPLAIMPAPPRVPPGEPAQLRGAGNGGSDRANGGRPDSNSYASGSQGPPTGHQQQYSQQQRHQPYGGGGAGNGHGDDQYGSMAGDGDSNNSGGQRGGAGGGSSNGGQHTGNGGAGGSTDEHGALDGMMMPPITAPSHQQQQQQHRPGMVPPQHGPMPHIMGPPPPYGALMPPFMNPGTMLAAMGQMGQGYYGGRF